MVLSDERRSPHSTGPPLRASRVPVIRASAIAQRVGNIAPNWHVDGTADFNGDGTTDLLGRNDNGYTGIWIMKNGRHVNNVNLGNIDPALLRRMTLAIELRRPPAPQPDRQPRALRPQRP